MMRARAGIRRRGSASAGSDSNAGTQASPVETIAQKVISAMTIGGPVDVFAAAGAGPDIGVDEFLA